MIRPFVAVLLLAALTVPGSARDRPDDRSRVPAAEPTGPAADCVPLSRLRESRVRDDRTIDFMTGNRTGYRVTLDAACPGLGFERAFSYATSLTQLCRQDIITVLYTTGGLQRGASCGLAPFQPVRFPAGR